MNIWVTEYWVTKLSKSVNCLIKQINSYKIADLVAVTKKKKKRKKKKKINKQTNKQKSDFYYEVIKFLLGIIQKLCNTHMVVRSCWICDKKLG